MQIDDREADLVLTASHAAIPEFGIRVTGVDPQVAEKLRRKVVDLMGVRGGPSPAPGDAEQQYPGGDEDAGIRVGLMGPSDPIRRHELERRVRAVVAEEVQGDRAASSGCVCYGVLPAQQVRIKPEDIGWFDSNGVWQPPPGSRPDWLIAVFLDVQGWNAAQLHLWNGATNNPPVPKNQVLVGLANATEWPKEIWADNLCSGRIGSVYHEQVNPTYRRMLLDAPDCYNGADTIVFRKPGLFGVWHDVSHFQPTDFWRAFGGTRCDFYWVKDY
jgi:hypothetical protein